MSTPISRSTLALTLALGMTALTGCRGSMPAPARAPLEASQSAGCAPFTVPQAAQLAANPKLPDPFRFLDGRHVNSAADWACRRIELAALVQAFELGDKPRSDSTVAGELKDDTLTVRVHHAGRAIAIPVKISYPATGSAPYPAMIGVGKVSLDTAALLRQGVAIVSFPNGLVAEQGGAASRGKGLFYELYGAQHRASATMAWSWGISRLIDALATTPAARLDPARLGVTGCSRNGKGALVAGAFDQRIALTIAQESGNGGASGWRVADAQRAAGQNVQTLRQIVQENVWFTDSFSQFAESVARLPFDQHTVMGLIAPRGLLVLENTSLEWLGNQSAYVTSMAARETWRALGQLQSMGFSQRGGHPHCQLPASQTPHVARFVARFLLHDKAGSFGVEESDGSFAKDLAPWIDWPTPALR